MLHNCTASGPDFGRTATGKEPKSAFRPDCYRERTEIGLPRRSRGKVRTVISRRKSLVWGQFWPGSRGSYILIFIVPLSAAWMYWKLKFCFRAKLECRVFEAVRFWFVDFVDLGRFQAPRGGCDVYSGRSDINSTLIRFAPVRFDIISTLFWDSGC